MAKKHWNLWNGGIIGIIKNLRDGYQFGDLSAGVLGFTNEEKNQSTFSDTINFLTGAGSQPESLYDNQQLLGGTPTGLGEYQAIQDEARQEFLDDRDHTEMREDTAYQRQVEDMKKAGLSPYTISAAPNNSSPSTAGANTAANKIQLLGYLLDLKNLDLKNKQVINSYLGTLLKALS